jgi:hypothetical protein
MSRGYATGSRYASQRGRIGTGWVYGGWEEGYIKQVAINLVAWQRAGRVTGLSIYCSRIYVYFSCL